MRDTYFGTDRDNVMSASATLRESFYGLEGNDTFYFYGVDGVDPDYDMSDRFYGGDGRDVLQNIKLYFDGTSGLSQLAQLSFDGGKGYDTLAVTISAQMADYTASSSVMDLTTIAPLLRSVEHRQYDVDLAVMSGSVNSLTIKGGALDETLRLHQEDLGTMGPGGEIIVSLGGGADRFEFSAEIAVISSLQLDTGTGADVVIMNASPTTYPDDFHAVIRTGGGADTIVLEGMYSETLNAGAGDDEIFVLTGSFAEAPDVIRTGAGRDRVYIELDSYSTVARIRDFAAGQDKIVFDAEEFRDTTITFDRKVWKAAETDMLYMDNAAGKLYFGDNLLVNFGAGTELSAKNFTTDTWDILADL